MDILEILRLVRAGESDRTIAQVLGHNRRSVTKYRRWAEAEGLLDGPPRVQFRPAIDTTRRRGAGAGLRSGRADPRSARRP